MERGPTIRGMEPTSSSLLETTQSSAAAQLQRAVALIACKVEDTSRAITLLRMPGLADMERKEARNAGNECVRFTTTLFIGRSPPPVCKDQGLVSTTTMFIPALEATMCTQTLPFSAKLARAVVREDYGDRRTERARGTQTTPKATELMSRDVCRSSLIAERTPVQSNRKA